MSEDLYERIAQFNTCQKSKDDDWSPVSTSSITPDSVIARNLQNRKDLKELLLSLSQYLKNLDRNSKDGFGKKLNEIGLFLGNVSSNHYHLADNFLCKIIVQCLVHLANLDCGFHHQASKVSDWAKSRLWHMLHDDSDRENCFAIEICGFEETISNDMASEMAVSYLRDRLSMCELDGNFHQLLSSLDIQEIMFIPQASSLTKAILLRHNSLRNDVKHQVSLAYNEQDDYMSQHILENIWLTDLEMFESAIVDLMEILLQSPDMPYAERLLIIDKSKIIKACATYPVLKGVVRVVLECFEEQSKAYPLVVETIHDFNHCIKEVEKSL